MINKENGLDTSFVRNIGIFLLVALLVTPAFMAINFIPGNFAELNNNNQNPINNPRGSKRTIVYDMNLSRNAIHQDMTIFPRRELFGGETAFIESLAIGDVNADGFDDIIIGAPGDNIMSKPIDSGIVFVIFGAPTLPNKYDLGTHLFNNLTIFGDSANDGLGSAVEVADLNGDLIDDIIVGASGKDYVYVFYGGQYLKSLLAPWDLSLISANSTMVGFVGDSFGSSLAASDLNQDGKDDIIIGAPNSQGDQNLKTNCGEIWIVEGYNVSSLLDLRNEPYPIWANVTVIYGKDSQDFFGTAVCSNGDFNGDGVSDIGITAPGGNGLSVPKNQAGEAYVIYWNDSIPAKYDLGDINNEANITVYGNHTDDRLGEHSVAFGDINGDNMADLIVGAPRADGNFVQNTGETYVIYGTTGYPKKHKFDLEQPANKSNVTVVFPDNNDRSGSWVDAFDWNGDNIDDLMITAPNGDGIGDNLFDIGEIIIINGSNTYFNPSLGAPRRYIDLNNRNPGFLVNGAELNDNLGDFTAYGDIDGDLKIDLVAFARGADGHKNNRTDGGELYVIPGAITFAPRIRGLNFLNGDGPLMSRCYAKYRSYEFLVNITTPLGVDDLMNASITIDPSGLNLKYTWDNILDDFILIRDPNNYTKLDSLPSNATSGSASGVDYWKLLFKLTFNWTCPSFNYLLPIKVDIYNTNNYHITRSFFQVFDIESRLNFNGSLVVKDEASQVLTDNSWLLGGKSLTFSGITVVYENTSNIYPKASEYEVILTNNTESWPFANVPGQEISKTIPAGTISKALDTYIINITKPENKSMSNFSFRISVDADNIEFYNPLPSTEEWQIETPVQCKIRARDYGGNLVDAESIQYRTSENNGGLWSNWTILGASTDSTPIQLSKKIVFSDGADNLIQWRGNDTLGNGYTTTEQYLIKVDTENVTFKNALPYTDEIFDDYNINFSIEIRDNTSGVNASSIEYSYSIDNGEIWTYWINLGLSGNFTWIKANASQRFSLGDGNLVKWRAMDLAGNGPLESEIQRFNVYIATTDLRANLISPKNDELVGNATPKLTWDCNDNSSKIVFDVYLSRVLSNVKDLKTTIKTGLTDKSYILEEPLEDGEVYYWTIIPRNLSGKQGINVDLYWSFQIDLNVTPPVEKEIPETSLIYPLNATEIKTLKPILKWSVKYKNPLERKLYYDLYIWKSTESVNNAEKIEDLTNTEYDWSEASEALDNHVTYKWRIGVRVEGLQGEYWLSSIWEFTTNVPPPEDFYDFIIETDDDPAFILKQGGNKVITIDVRNLKDTEGTVELSVSSSTMETSVFQLSHGSVSIQGFEVEQSILSITIPEDHTKGEFLFSVDGVMDTDKGKITKSIEFKITITPKDDGDNGVDGDGDKDTVDNTMMYASIVIIIIIIVLVLLFLLLQRKKKEPVEETGVAPALMEPGPGMEMEQAPVAAPVAPMAAPVGEGEPLAEGMGMPEESIEPMGEPIGEGEEFPVTDDQGLETEMAPPAGPVEPGQPMVEPGMEPLEGIESTAEEPGMPTTEELPPELAEPEMPGDLPGDAYQEPPAEEAAPVEPEHPESTIEPEQAPESEETTQESKKPEDENA